ncbi:MICOS complex subunit MIC27 [Bombyx mori]|uniref:MICOS complex subunit n=1 Tax=Bombyx mori TaxID=7091 RepID=A0A8R1WPE3_BOMMO|nr:MICOS complex subunit MIC27 [Bombyx mori]
MRRQLTNLDTDSLPPCPEDTSSEDDSHLDLYIIGKLWIDALRSALLGAKIVPTVEAAKTEVPTKPPPMRLNELPLYDNPHQIYKDYLEDLEKCPKAKSKMLHEYLQPHVTALRMSAQCNYCDFKCELESMKEEICVSMRKAKTDFKAYMRDPKNLELRHGVVGIGALSGYLFASKRGIPGRLFFTSLGALAGGALCFPKETDEIFRSAMYHFGKAALGVYNLICSHNLSLRDRLPCEADQPAPKELKKLNKCTK